MYDYEMQRLVAELQAADRTFWFVFWLAVVYSVVVHAVLGYIVGERRGAGAAGTWCGLLGGPLGVIAAFALDARPRCHRCCTRVERQARVCPACGLAFAAAPATTTAATPTPAVDPLVLDDDGPREDAPETDPDVARGRAFLAQSRQRRLAAAGERPINGPPRPHPQQPWA